MKAHSGEVGVFVRIRPTANFADDLIECLPDGQTVNICHKRDSRKSHDSKKSQLSCWSFRLEGVLQDVSQEEFYARVCRRVVLGALDGYNGTVMCFGQTGAGKTYTITGSTESYKQRGIIPRALQEVFQEVEKRTEHAFSVYLSYLEIYNETLVDLLSPRRCSPHPSPHSMVVMEEPGRGVFIRGLSLHLVHSEEEALNLLFEGEMNRIIGSHALNRNSSRSHCIFTVHIESRSRTLSDAKYITSKLNLVDLAGSERLGKTGSEGQMLKEAVYINKSLSFLEQAILALADRRRDHVPFRQSKLTHALKDSLGGNCNTVLVANIYGEAAQIEETLSTLRFASRMRCVRTDPAVNEHMDPAHIKKLQKDIQRLKEELSICNKLANRPSISYESLSEAQLAEINNQVQRYLEGSLEEISEQELPEPDTEKAFEVFKVGQGSKINCILKENKAVLLERRTLLRKLTDEVNAVKREIDCTTATIQQHKELRRDQGTPNPQLQEPDATLLKKLRELKARYRQRYDVLGDIKAEVNYCQHLVDQCRVRLLSEFENWYKKSFLVPEEELDVTTEKTLTEVSVPHIYNSTNIDSVSFSIKQIFDSHSAASNGNHFCLTFVGNVATTFLLRRY
uniref:Kinesin-like protein n=1 Tax=Dicentrarchus labrax TaxID=13489 RepID=A0A8C4FC62_DICLA